MAIVEWDENDSYASAIETYIAEAEEIFRQSDIYIEWTRR